MHYEAAYTRSVTATNMSFYYLYIDTILKGKEECHVMVKLPKTIIDGTQLTPAGLSGTSGPG